MIKKTILITGGCGFIGTNISLYAIKSGYSVIAFDSLVRKHSEENAHFLQSLGVEVVRGDIRNTHDLERIPNVDVIIHLAANPGIPWSISWPLYDFSTNALGTLNILEFSRSHGKIPVIYASTNKIYSEEINLLPVKENGKRLIWNLVKNGNKLVRLSVFKGVSENGVNEHFPMDSAGLFPHSPYGTSKATGDLYCQEYYHIYGIPTVVNRMSCIYGLHQKGVEDQGWVDWFVKAKIYNLPLNIYGNGKQVRDALFGTDLAKLYIMEIDQIEKAKGQVFNVGGGIQNTISLLETIEYLNQKGGKKLSLTFKEWRPADHKIYISDITKVQALLGWSPTVSVYEGIDQMWEEYTRKNIERNRILQLL